MGIHRFGKKIIGAVFQPMGNFIFFRFRRQQDKIAIAICIHRAQLQAKLKPCHPRHHPIADNQVGAGFFALLQSIRARAGFGDAVAPPIEHRRYNPAL